MIHNNTFIRGCTIEMVDTTFIVKHYYIQLGDTLDAGPYGPEIKARGVISCLGEDQDKVTYVFFAYFLRDDSPVRGPFYNVRAKRGGIFVPFKEMGTFVDILRNEKPIYAYLDSDDPKKNRISTLWEDVGEGETENIRTF